MRRPTLGVEDADVNAAKRTIAPGQCGWLDVQGWVAAEHFPQVVKLAS
jgi:hypothetical protein